MPVHDLFSKRQKRLRGEAPDVYSYDEIPQDFRVQIVQILNDSLGTEYEYNDDSCRVGNAYRAIVKILRREYGVFEITPISCRNIHEELMTFLLNQRDAEKILDAIELSFRMLDRSTRTSGYKRTSKFDEIADDAISELNMRFREHGIGYQFENGEIIRVDSQFLHAEAIKPALTLLNEKQYAGAQQEFLSAYEHYRHGKQKEALNDALKAFESTLKIICDKRHWAYNPTDTSKTLLDICFKNGLVPVFWQQHMSGLRSLLEGGVPTGRNKLSSHGQGATPVEIPEYIVSYVLHMTGAAIVLLAKAEEALK